MIEKRNRPSWGEIHKMQIQEMLKHKWIESEKAGHDLGEAAICDWIAKYAAAFRDHWGKGHDQ